MYKDDIVYKSTMTNPLKKAEIHGYLKSNFTNPGMHCKKCIDQHNICPCAGINGSSFQIKQRSIYSNHMGNGYGGNVGIYTYIQTLGWDNDRLLLLLRIAANLTLSFWDCEALTMIESNVYMPGLVLNDTNPKHTFNGKQSLYLISYGDYLSKEAEVLLTQYTVSGNNLTKQHEIRDALIKIYDPSRIIKAEDLTTTIFNLQDNHLDDNCTEASFNNQMILVKNFIAHIYKRLGLIKLLKIIILFPLIDCLKKILLYHLFETNPNSVHLEQLKQCPPNEALFQMEYIKHLSGVHRGLYYSIKELLRTFKVFAFNGSNYDNPLIFPLLMLSLIHI